MKNTVKAILNNLNESLTLDEARTIDLGGGKSAYSYGGNYYIKSGDTKKEISADQYNKLKSKDVSKNNSSEGSSSNKSYKTNNTTKKIFNMSHNEGFATARDIEDMIKEADATGDEDYKQQIMTSLDGASKLLGCNYNDIATLDEDSRYFNDIKSYIKNNSDFKKGKTIGGGSGPEYTEFTDKDGTKFIIGEHDPYGQFDIIFMRDPSK